MTQGHASTGAWRRVRRVVIVDSRPLVRRGLRLLLDGWPGLMVCGVARCPREALTKVGAGRADLLVGEAGLRLRNGSALQGVLRRVHPDVAVVTYAKAR